MALAWMVKRESGRQEPCGGILADDQVRRASPSSLNVVLNVYIELFIAGADKD